jgi:hypothetical protein
MSPDEAVVEDDPVVRHIKHRLRDLSTEREKADRELREADEMIQRHTDRRRWTSEFIAGLEVERQLLTAWLNTST